MFALRKFEDLKVKSRKGVHRICTAFFQQIETNSLAFIECIIFHIITLPALIISSYYKLLTDSVQGAIHKAAEPQQMGNVGKWKVWLKPPSPKYLQKIMQNFLEMTWIQECRQVNQQRLSHILKLNQYRSPLPAQYLLVLSSPLFMHPDSSI